LDSAVPAQALCAKHTGHKPCIALKLMVHHDVHNSCVTSVCPSLQAVLCACPAASRYRQNSPRVTVVLLAHLSLLQPMAPPQPPTGPCACCNNTAYDQVTHAWEASAAVMQSCSGYTLSFDRTQQQLRETHLQIYVVDKQVVA